MIYFDNAATTLIKPQKVAEAVMQAMCSMGNAGRGAHTATLDASRIIYGAREKLARFFGAENPRQIVFTANSTEALNTALKGTLDPGDHVVTTVLEHNSVLRPLYELEKKGVQLTVVGCDEKGNVGCERIFEAVRANTKAVVCTHASNLTGNLVDIRGIGEQARRRGLLFIVDASQTAGVFPIRVQEMKIDILCFTGHKGMMGPQGTGGLYVREGLFVRPLKTGGSGVQTYSREHPKEMPTALEAGTLNGHGIAGLSAAVDFLGQVGIDRIREHEQGLMRLFYEGVKEVPGVRLYGDFSRKERCAIVSLNIGDYDSSEVSDELLMTYGIATRAGGHCAPLMHEALGTREQGAVRFSFSWHNTREEVEAAIHAVRELAEE